MDPLLGWIKQEGYFARFLARLVQTWAGVFLTYLGEWVVFIVALVGEGDVVRPRQLGNVTERRDGRLRPSKVGVDGGVDVVFAGAWSNPDWTQRAYWLSKPIQIILVVHTSACHDIQPRLEVIFSVEAWCIKFPVDLVGRGLGMLLLLVVWLGVWVVEVYGDDFLLDGSVELVG